MGGQYKRSGCVKFGDEFELDLGAFELRSRRIPLKLKPIAMELLIFLVERGGQLVTREEIVERIWGKGVFLDSDNGINNAINKIRQALRDKIARPKFIQTVTGRGYRFIAPVVMEVAISTPGAVRNVPPQRTTVIGRDEEIEYLCRRLRSDHIRMVTLTGIGGVGKTTLAEAVARQLTWEFPDGVCFVDLSAIRQPELVGPAIAQALAVQDPDRNWTAVKAHVTGRKLLLILDNFEQVLSASHYISAVLQESSGLKILITSRALLQVRGELEYVVPPLGAPPSTTGLSVAELGAYDAVNLFVERAKSVRADFALTDENAESVVRICSRLEGLPLAIELAAARVKILSPQVILQRLDRRLSLLTGGSRDLPARQKTMGATIEWSYELLSDEEKRLFRCLSVFAGGFTVDAAEVTLNDPGALEAISSLVNQSLVVAPQGKTQRLHLLEVVREYARERLDASPDADATCREHAAYFLALAELAEPELQGAQPAEWLDRLDQEYGNIRAALSWSLSHDPETAARIAAAIRYFWDYQGYLTEGLGILKSILSATNGSGGVRSKLLNMAGNIAKFQADFQTATAMYDAGLREALAADNLQQASMFYRGLGSLAISQGDAAAAHRFAEQALSAARMVNDPFSIALSLNMLGDLARLCGEDHKARPLFEEALGTCRQLGKRYATGNILNNLAAAEFALQDYCAADLHFSEALSMSTKTGNKIVGDRISISYSLDGLAALAAERGEAVMAARFAGAAEQVRDAMNFNIEAPEHRFRCSYLARLKQRLSPEDFLNAYDEGRRTELDQIIDLALDSKCVVSSPAPSE